MRASGTELLQEKGRTFKFVLNESAILIFPGNQEHRSFKSEGVSYEDDYRGNALAGMITPGRVEIRFHAAFSDERVRNLWVQVRKLPDLAGAALGDLYYQGRQLG